MASRSSRVVLLVFAMALAPAGLLAQNFIYVNNNVFSSTSMANTVTGYSVSTSGALTPLPGSPFATGGNGLGASFFPSSELALAPDGKFLFAGNLASDNISVFSINKATGALTLVGSPVQTGECDLAGISLAEAVTSGGKFLYAANSCSGNISTFSVGGDGTLTPVGTPVPVDSKSDFVAGISVRPDGEFLAAALPYVPNKVAVFNIGPGGALTAVPGSPFAAGGAGEESTVDYKCGSKTLFGGESNNTETILDVYDVASNGALGAISGSPFTFGGSGTAVNSNDVLFSPFSQLLFVTNPFSDQVTDFNVASDGSLTPVSGAPFADGGAWPDGLALGSVTDPLTGVATTFLYAVNSLSHNVSVFSVADGGALTAVGKPVSTGQLGYPVSIVAYPPLGCRIK